MSVPVVVRRWLEPPAMAPGAPEPVVIVRSEKLFVAYRCHNSAFPGWDSGLSPDHPGFDDVFAILQFSGVRSHSLGPPSEETLARDPLFKLGVSCYGFYSLSAAAESEWVITFHDETLRVVAEDASVLIGPAVSEHLTTRDVLNHYLSTHPAA